MKHVIFDTFSLQSPPCLNVEQSIQPNEKKKIVPLFYLEEGDLIKIKIIENKIKKIYINSKYKLISDSSEEYLSN
jgi:hypothetical protein